MTKIMNEGWASYWHSRILTEKVLKASEIIDYAQAMAGVLATNPKRLNPYKLGIELWRDIEERWNRGMFGREWEDCRDLEAREAWDTGAGEGQAKMFQIRKLYNDITFIDEFLTEDFVERQNLYTFGYNPKKRQWEISSKEFQQVKSQLLDSLTNFGQPSSPCVTPTSATAQSCSSPTATSARRSRWATRKTSSAIFIESGSARCSSRQ